MRYGGETYYAWYRWDLQETPAGTIVKNITRIDKMTGEQTRLGSMFVQPRTIPERSVYNPGVNSLIVRMLNKPR